VAGLGWAGQAADSSCPLARVDGHGPGSWGTSDLTACCPRSIAFRPPLPLQILESSQTLLNVLKRETVNLTKKRQVSA
jgi:hypothetical protein